MLRLVILAALVAFTWLLAARIFGPTDLWDQTQPKTISYTTDMVANGRWILPMERGALPATKPPMYNWFAVPAVAGLGFNNEFAHKFPSVAAMIICCASLVRIGRRFAPTSEPALGSIIGWLAVVFVSSSYTMFKLGYLARPDMLLVLWCLLGWWAGTSAIINKETGSRRTACAAAFWLCIALAGLTKGPAAFVLVVYGGVAPWVIVRRWFAVNRLQWWWGAPAALVVIALWVLAAWRINPQHVYEQLWYAEFYGRFTGLGPEGSREGFLGTLRTAHLPAFYFLTRFAPWSFLTVAAMITVWKRKHRSSAAGAIQASASTSCWIRAAMLFVVLTIVLYTLSSSKKPDYIAPAVPVAALLAAWWTMSWLRRSGTPTIAGVAISIAAAVSLSAMTIFNIRQPAAPVSRFGEHIQTFINETEHHLAERRQPVVFCWTGYTHLQAMLGYSVVDDTAAFEHQYALGDPFWVVAGCRKGDPPMFDAWIADRRRFNAAVNAVVISRHLPRAFGWPEQVGLYHVTPIPPAQSNDRP